MIKTGRYISYLLIPLILVIVYATIMRYVFRAPPIWGFEVSLFLYGIHLILGASICHAYNKHVSVDIINRICPEKVNTFLKCLSELLVLLTCFVLVYYGSSWARRSFLINQRSIHGTEWNPIIWWFKFMVPLGGLFLGIQSLLNLKGLLWDRAKEQPQ